jgi:hypothetical protein
VPRSSIRPRRCPVQVAAKTEQHVSLDGPSRRHVAAGFGDESADIVGSDHPNSVSLDNTSQSIIIPYRGMRQLY